MDTETNKPNAEGENLTFDEILKDKAYQSEFDKRVSKAIDTAKSKWENEAKTKQSEADKLARMDADEKHKYELEKERTARDSAVAELNAYKLKDQAIKIASEKGLDVSLLEIFDYSNETADTMKTKLENVDKVFKKAVEDGINKRLQEKSPRQVRNGNMGSDQEYLNNKYKNSPYYKA